MTTFEIRTKGNKIKAHDINESHTIDFELPKEIWADNIEEKWFENQEELDEFVRLNKSCVYIVCESDNSKIKTVFGLYAHKIYKYGKPDIYFSYNQFVRDDIEIEEYKNISLKKKCLERELERVNNLIKRFKGEK